MWAIYWRFLLAVFIVFSITVIVVQQFSLLTLIENSRYHPTAFWLIAAAIAATFSIATSKGLTHSFFGNRLNFSPEFWQFINASFVALFLFLALLGAAFQAFASASIWTIYKLYFQPVSLIIYPWLAGGFVLKRLKNNKLL
jgi:intracellular septation protein A